jgi:DNA polymerase III alpha subunit
MKIATKPARRPVQLPAHIGYLVHQMREEQGISLDMSVSPLEDAETFSLIQSGDTDNIPMLDSKIVQECLIMFRPATIEELATAMAIATGGVRWSGGTYEFIERYHGRKKVEYDLPELEPILKSTFGIVVYAEQVIKIVETIADFSSSECITLSFHLSENMQRRPFEVAIMQHKERFLAGAKQKGYPAEKAEAIFSIMSKFSQFDFYDATYAENHAVAAYRCAYLKAHYPNEYNALFGIYSEPHPLIEHVQLISQQTNATTATIDRFENNTAVRICGYIHNLKELAAKKGSVVGIGDLEDQYGFIKILIQEEVLRQHREKLQSQEPMIISGILENSDSANMIKVENVEFLK